MPEEHESRQEESGGTNGNTGSGTETSTSDVDTATTTKETRWEIGFFVRRVETQSETPPSYPNPKPDDT